MAKTSVRNVAAGVRGFYLADGSYRELAPGVLADDLELSEAERNSAESTGYFEFGSAARATPEAPVDPNALPTKVGELKALAQVEGIDVSNAKGAAELTAAIETERARRLAAGPIDGAPRGRADDLDNLADDDLRDTVAALTGKPVADFADTDRDGLLSLARGE